MDIEPLSGAEKIALAAFYWRFAGYPAEHRTMDALKMELENHFGPRGLVDHLIL